MILVIRGHIRNSFETQDLINFIKKIYELNKDLKIYIHTWNIIANNISWRKIKVNETIVTEEIIYNYFGDLKHLIKHIIIDDDSKIQLIGKTEGKLNGVMPLIGWKNYWYSKYQIINYLYDQNINSNEQIVNFRFDIFSNSNNFNMDVLISFIKNNENNEFTKNKFLFEDATHCGIDNIYMGNIITLHKLVKHFFYNLDDILKNSKNMIHHQEFLVFMLNDELFTSL